MNVGDEHSLSFWMQDAPPTEASKLLRDLECDVVVVGSGIAGLSTAYELTRFGRSVIVIDRGRIGRGMTARTTAHLATELDDFYSELIRIHGEDAARLQYDSQVAAVNRIEAICRDERIDADFVRLDGYLFAAEPSDRSRLEEEFEACRSIGVDVEWADRAPVPGIDTGRALRFPNQGRFHPMKYLAGLADAIGRHSGRLFADTASVADEEKNGRVEITTETGHVIRGGAAVFATNSPTNSKVAIHSKQLPNRTYVVAGRVPKGSVPDALIWDTERPYHYVRIQPLDAQEDLLISGGGDHRSGECEDIEGRIAELEQWTRERYLALQRIDYRWSGQVLEPVDFMPFSGRSPGKENIYIHTGDSGQGITNGVAGSLTILPLIIGEDSRFAPLFAPDRKTVAPSAVKGLVRGAADATKNFAEYLGPGEVGSADELQPGQGALMRSGLKKLAVYKADDGRIITRSATCTHLGCLVHWNGFEKCWDCPCHGSQFAPDGAVLNGPAVSPLASEESEPRILADAETARDPHG